MVFYHKPRKNSDISHFYQNKMIRKNKQLLAIIFFCCEGNHNLSLNQFVTYLNWLKSDLNTQMFSFPIHPPL